MRSAVRLKICSLLSHCACAPRKRATACTLALTGAFCTFILLTTTQPRMLREELMEQRLAEMHVHLQFLETLYNARQEELLAVQVKFLQSKNNNSQERAANSAHLYGISQSTLSPELRSLLRNISGTHAVEGFNTKHRQSLALASVYQLLPHLLSDPYSLRPAYHMKGNRTFVDIVLGVPTVKRDKESYLMITLTHLISGLGSEHENSTLIVVLVGETDLEYVFNVAHQIETKFPKHVKKGLIEVISPPSSFYPNLEELEPTLGDPIKRVKWRTKQNLDAMFLMTYAQTKGAFYLMLEDDIIAKKNYMKEIKKFAALVTISNPQWLILEFCHIGGIGKLFRSSSLQHFVTYVQLFYKNLPIDWLIESYLADKVCTIDKSSKQCLKNKLGIRPRYKTSLFQHIGLYSSLKGKIQKLKDSHFGTVPSFYPHSNPPLELIRSDIEEYTEHTVKKAYNGDTYFWGLKPKKGDLVEFHFKTPVLLHRYLFRSGNVEHVSDKFTDTVVEVLPVKTNGTFVAVGEFDEFGLAEGTLKKDFGRISAVRLNVKSNSKYWVILSEVLQLLTRMRTDLRRKRVFIYKDVRQDRERDTQRHRERNPERKRDFIGAV